MEFLLYLAGPIKGLTYAGATTWREYVSQKLPPYIKTLSPLRAKEYLASITAQIGQDKLNDGAYANFPLSTDQAVVTRDRSDVMRSEMIFFNFIGATVASVGSCIEIGWADAFRKPFVVAIEKDATPDTNPHFHSMIRETAGWIVHDLDSGIAIVKAVLSPDSYLKT